MIDFQDLQAILLENNKSILVLGIFILLDILTGVTKAAHNGELVSSKFRTGIIKKFFEVVLIIVGFCLDYLTEMLYIGNTVVVCFVAMEGYSILENTSEFVTLPEILRNILETLQGEKNKNDL